MSFRCSDHGLLVKPSQVFIRSEDPGKTSTSSLVQTTEKKVQDDSEIDLRGLVDFVAFGPKANSFHLRIGVQRYPRTSTLAELLID